MEMTGERAIAADRAAVWTALNDPEVLKACIPGCQSMERSGENGFTAKVVQKVGPVKATFTGEVELSDIVEGESYTISGKGKGGAAGGASGGAKVRLEDQDGGTLLTYEAEAKVTGKIAQLGSRLIDGFAKKMADDFFTRFQEAVEGDTAAGESPAEAIAEDAEQAFKDMSEGAAAEAKSIGDQVGETVDEAIGAVKDLAEKADEASRTVAQSVAGAADQAKETFEKAADHVKDQIEAAEPKKKGFWARLFGL